jgi:hypothetical protein
MNNETINPALDERWQTNWKFSHEKLTDNERELIKQGHLSFQQAVQNLLKVQTILSERDDIPEDVQELVRSIGSMNKEGNFILKRLFELANDPAEM